VPSSAWWNTAWTARRKITFNNTGQPQNLVNFPVLVRLDTSRIDYSQTQGLGQDLRFVDADDNTVLDHEIERWTPGGNSYVWVRVPQIDASSGTDFIYMYYGNTAASAPPLASQQATWDTGFKMVQHLHQTGGGATGHKDSTSNNINSNAINVTAQGTATGRIDGADSFTAANFDNVDIAHNATLNLGAAESFTVETWVKTPTATAFAVCKKTDAGSGDWQLWINGGKAIFWLGDGAFPTNAIHINSTVTVNDNTWHYLVGRWDGSANTADLFVDGAFVSNQTNPAIGALVNTNPLVIGEEGDTGRGFNLDGTIDEVRFSKTLRSTEWIRAQHLSMSDSFIQSVGAPEAAASVDPVATSLTTVLGAGQITVNTPDVTMVWEAAQGGGLRRLYGKNEANPGTSRVGTDGRYNLFNTDITTGSQIREVAAKGALDLLEATPTRAKVRQGRGFTPTIRIERDFTVYSFPRLGIRERLTLDTTQSVQGSTGIYARTEGATAPPCPGAASFYCGGRSDSSNTFWLLTDSAGTYSDMLAVPTRPPSSAGGHRGSPATRATLPSRPSTPT
jgi:hypothetical protein